ncbi:Clathrin light chain [Fusarium torreyae]|uniref:Clathrin light chain n=1 Tax=Fusarium torreyae TaxID=1237075 RepID=A0A9W8RRN1_9HYPO|nr:Clathrin light chain [Fusarium torreyae]
MASLREILMGMVEALSLRQPDRSSRFTSRASSRTPWLILGPLFLLALIRYYSQGQKIINMAFEAIPKEVGPVGCCCKLRRGHEGPSISYDSEYQNFVKEQELELITERRMCRDNQIANCVEQFAAWREETAKEAQQKLDDFFENP